MFLRVLVLVESYIKVGKCSEILAKSVTLKKPRLSKDRHHDDGDEDDDDDTASKDILLTLIAIIPAKICSGTFPHLR